MRKLHLVAATLALSGLCASPLYAARTEPVKNDPAKAEWGDISIENARLMEGDSCVSMNLTNNGIMIDALLRAETKAAGLTLLVDQRMHRDVHKIELMPKVPLKIEAGKACIITHDFVVAPKAGDKLKYELTFEHGGKKEVIVNVIANENHKAEIKPAAKIPEVKKAAPVTSPDDAEVVQ